ncbi:TetR/AcrR family transcriptional regulator [Streptomyces sp. CA-253872]|uniref:TetR/AcrR family transcriptional regulator n=1 Tax=Streptomyces sp. CA-253872 TaxID=3240067 RepID=UPI003D90D1B7
MPTSPAPPTGEDRNTRRRARTRQALLRAARQILAEDGDTSVSIQEIAQRADVGFGSFYNHFASKTELFEAAVEDALEEFGHTFDAQLASVTDPAELVAAGFRLSVRMADSHPELMRVLRHRALAHLHSDQGLAPRARRDIELGIATGRFTDVDPLAAFTAVGGSLLALIDLRFTRPDLPPDPTATTLAAMTLRMLGLPAEEAREVAGRPLPGEG